MTATVYSPDTLVKLVDLPAPAARIRLKPRSNDRGMVDGAWWPRTRDLSRELPPLIAAVEREPGWSTIHHATVNVHMWPAFPKKIRTGSHVVRVGWFDAEQDPNDICLISISLGGRWDLLVVPPELEPDAAARLMVRASTPGNSQTASALLAMASAHLAGPTEEPEALGAWESEGGSPRRFGTRERAGYAESPDPHARLEPVPARA
jgi:hypothetical protein